MGKNAAKSHNLKEVIKNFSDNMRYDDYGLNSLDYEIPQDTDDVIISVAVEKAKGTRDMSFANEYLKRISNNEITPEPYFTENDGEIYWLLKRWLEVKDKPNKESDVRLIDLCRFFNVLNRQVNGDMYKMFDPIKDHLHDKLNAKAISKAYHSGKTIKIAPSLESPVTFSIYGKQWTRNPLKEAAWGVVHSYLIDRLMSENYQYRLVPKDRELVIIWNHYIDMMNDVPEEVKKYYYLNNDCESLFTKHFKNEIENAEKELKEKEEDHPVDDNETGATDIPFEDAIVNDTNNVIKIFPEHNGKEVVIETKEEEVPFQDVSNETKKGKQVVDGKFEVIRISSDGTETTITEKENDNKKEEQTDQKPAKEQIESVIVQSESVPNIKTRPEEPDANIRTNNDAFEKVIPKLNRFTNICRRVGYSVLYGQNANYPMLVQCIIINRSTGLSERSLLIDPCIIYGDTLRIVTMSSKKLDIRKESFVAVSQFNLVEKIVRGTFGKEERKKNFEQLPHCLNDFRDTYSFIDRIDLHDVQRLTMKSDGKTISFNEWKKLIINVSNIFKDQNIPVCRFRIQEYKDCNNFKLICDDKVQIFYKSNLANEESQKKAMSEMFWVDYNPEQYGDSKYAYGTITAVK